LFLLDYDGTLTPLVKHPKDAVPSKELLNLLKKLTSDPNNDVFIITGRDKNVMEEWLGHLPVGMACEHGCFWRYPPRGDGITIKFIDQCILIIYTNDNRKTRMA
jgi:trehalose 6-phosphate synthase/phosphatase